MAHWNEHKSQQNEKYSNRSTQYLTRGPLKIKGTSYGNRTSNDGIDTSYYKERSNHVTLLQPVGTKCWMTTQGMKNEPRRGGGEGKGQGPSTNEYRVKFRALLQRRLKIISVAHSSVIDI